MKHPRLVPALLLCAAAIFSHAQPSQAQDLDVGSNSSSVTTNFTSGTNIYRSAYIGFTDTADNNALNVFNPGTVLTIRTNFFLGSSGSSNTVTISNGASVTAGANLPAAVPVAIGSTTNATGNILLVTGTGSSFSAAGNFTNGMNLGDAASGNSVVISNGGSVTAGRFRVGNQASASNNSVLVTGSDSVLNGGTITLGNDGSFNSITVSNGGRVIGDGVVGVTSNAFGNSVLLTGAGTTWSNNNSFTLGERGSGNSLTVSDGAVISAGNGFSIGRFAGSTNNTVLVTGAGSTMRGINANIDIGSGGAGAGVLTVANGGALNIGNRSIIIGALSNSSGVLNVGAFGGTDSAGSINALSIAMGYSGSASASGGLATVNFNQTNTLVLSSSITGYGNVNQLGTGTTILLGNNGYDGVTTINEGGVLALGNGGTSGWISGMQGRPPGPITNNGTLQFNRSDDQFFDGAISGGGSVLKSGNGSVYLTASNSYTGPTTVAAGKLMLFFGSIAASAVTVQDGGTLGGIGNAGATTIQSGGTISPGLSPGNLTVEGNLVWNGGGNYNWQVLGTTNTAGFAAGVTWDLLTVNGTLDLTALTPESKFNINLWSLASSGPDVSGNITDFSATGSYEWLAVVASNITGFDAADFNVNYTATNGTDGFSNPIDPTGTFSVRRDGGNLYVTYNAVPEPSTFALLALAAAGLGAHVLRRRRK